MPLARNAASSTGVHKPDFLNMLLNYLVVPYLASSDWHIAEYYLVLSRDAAQASAAFSLGCLPSSVPTASYASLYSWLWRASATSFSGTSFPCAFFFACY